MMKKYTKLAVLALIFILSIALAACADISIDGGITAENEVSLTYTMQFNDLDRDSENYKELKKYLDDVVDNWKDAGFDSKLVKDDNSLTAECTISEICETREQAFEALYGMMTNELSVFDSVDYSYTKDFYKEEYMISGKIDISNIVDESIEENYPKHIMSAIEDFYENSTFKISFSLPYNDSDTTGEVGMKEFSKEVSFDNQTAFIFSGIIKNFANAEHERQVNAEKADYEKKILYSAIASGVLLLALLAIIIIKVVKGKKKKAAASEGEEPVEMTPEQKAQAKAEAAAAKAKAKEEKAKVKAEKAKAKAEKAKTKEEKAQEKAEKAKAKEEANKAKELAKAEKAKEKELAKAEKEKAKAEAEAEKAKAEEKTEE